MKGYTSGRHTLEEAAERCKLAGYEWAALELDDDETGPYNLSIWDQFTMAFRLHGLQPGCWVTAGGNIFMAPPDADFAIAECEGPGDYEGITNVINGVGAGPLPKCPLAIITNFNTPLVTREAAKPLIDNGFTCLTEAYTNEAANITADSMDRIARNLGWPTSQPVFGVYPVNGQPPPSYAQWADWPGADYLGEYVI